MRLQFLPLIILSPYSAFSVLHGDEQYGDQRGGRFWAFHSAGVSIVNPENCNVERTFSVDEEGNYLPASWTDGVYMERSNENETYNTEEDFTMQEGFIIINSGVIRFDGGASPDGGTGQVFVFSTSPNDYDQPLRSKVDISGRPVHSYAVYTRDEFWTHSDAGYLYIMELDDLTRHTGKPIDIKEALPSYGKLLWDENEDLINYGYVTSREAQHVFIIDMISRTRFGTFDFGNFVAQNSCRGTDSIAYSSKNQHLFIECVPAATDSSRGGPGSIIEIDVSDPRNPLFVGQHHGITGTLYETPDEATLLVTNKDGNKVHIIEPQQTGQISSIAYDINVPGHPSGPVFFPSDSGGRADYIACMALTENTNRNHMDSDGNIVCDFYSCSQASTTFDVSNGICLYDDNDTGYLLTANINQIEDVINHAAPFGNACSHCELHENYIEGRCQCTPSCGSCAADDYDATISGVRCVDLNEVIRGNENMAALIAGAGSVKQGKPYGFSPQCGFGHTYRDHKRGGLYEASVANFPYNSIQIVNMETQSFHCAASLSGEPSRIVYVPPGQNGKVSDNNYGNNDTDAKLPRSAKAGIALGILAGIALVGFMCFQRRVDDTLSLCFYSRREEEFDDSDSESSKDISTGSSHNSEGN